MTTPRLEMLHAEALRLDESDPAPKRDAFELPRNDKGTLAYLTGNSLGPLPKQTRNELATELDDWSRLAVDAHFEGSHPWYDAHLALASPPLCPPARVCVLPPPKTSRRPIDTRAVCQTISDAVAALY